jgi:DNA-binding winged helix-turn-helix (wHTH) protein
VENSGRILDKEELLGKIWPDTFVEEVSLAKKISLLRKTLGEDVAHHYIETIPRRGYRFVADVREFQQDSAEAGPLPGGTGQKGSAIQEPSKTQTGLDIASQRSAILNSSNQTVLPLLRPGRQLVVLGLLSLVFVIGFVVWQVWLHRAARIVTPSLKALPLTTFQGRESQAAFSPMATRSPSYGTAHRAITLIFTLSYFGDETPLRLTSSAQRPTASRLGRRTAIP